MGKIRTHFTSKKRPKSKSKAAPLPLPVSRTKEPKNTEHGKVTKSKSGSTTGTPTKQPNLPSAKAKPKGKTNLGIKKVVPSYNKKRVHHPWNKWNNNTNINKEKKTEVNIEIDQQSEDENERLDPLMRLSNRVAETEKKLAVILSWIQNQYGDDHDIIRVVKSSLGQPLEEELIHNIGKCTKKFNRPMFSPGSRVEYPRHVWVPAKNDAVTRSDYNDVFEYSKKVHDGTTNKIPGILEMQHKRPLDLLKEQLDENEGEEDESQLSNIPLSPPPQDYPEKPETFVVKASSSGSHQRRSSIFASVYSSDDEDMTERKDMMNNQQVDQNTSVMGYSQALTSKDSQEFNPQIQYLVPIQLLPMVQTSEPAEADESEQCNFRIISTTTIAPEEFQSSLTGDVTVTNSGDGDSGHYNCSDCNKRFISVRQLARHQLTHNNNIKNAGKKLQLEPKTNVAKFKTGHVPAVAKQRTNGTPVPGRGRGRGRPRKNVAPLVKPKLNAKPDEEGPIQCENCDRILPTQNSYNYHKLIQHSQRKTVFLCSNCKKCFSSRIALRFHEKREHGMDLTKEYRCAKCSESFGSAQRLIEHLKTHNNNSTTSTNNANNTIKLRLYSCDTCRKTFNNKKKLEDHQKRRGHYPSKKKQPPVPVQHICKICGLPLKFVFALNKHMQTAHGVKAGKGMNQRPGKIGDDDKNTQLSAKGKSPGKTRERSPQVVEIWSNLKAKET